ncbi:MAG: restriction endonuclease [Candidatus Omnitrophica bacterium]|nr:restriction endonuclease [Candidatus Omnitrophota bacterium]
MNAPTVQDYLLPVLKAFENDDEQKYNEIIEYISANYKYIQNDRPKRSMIMINNCIGQYVKALVIEKIDIKRFKISRRGKGLLKNASDAITIKDLRQFKEYNNYIKNRYKKSIDKNIPDLNDEIPEEKIESAYEIFRESLADEILEKVRNSSWQFFEVIVKDLLVAMGYGDPHDEARISRGPGDEGIDGVIKEDKLGLDIICLQAKKWENSVGRPDIQKFTGSLESKRTKKGVFITTSLFTREAYQYVDNIEKKIILIDGQKLAGLMIDYNIGVSDSKTIILKKIDSDYFDN